MQELRNDHSIGTLSLLALLQPHGLTKSCSSLIYGISMWQSTGSEAQDLFGSKAAPNKYRARPPKRYSAHIRGPERPQGHLANPLNPCLPCVSYLGVPSFRLGTAVMFQPGVSSCFSLSEELPPFAEKKMVWFSPGFEGESISLPGKYVFSCCCCCCCFFPRGVFANGGTWVQGKGPGYDVSPCQVRTHAVSNEQDSGWLTWECVKIGGPREVHVGFP